MVSGETSYPLASLRKLVWVKDVEPQMLEYDEFPLAPMILDNAILSTSWQHQELVVNKLLNHGRLIDINSGFDVRVFEETHFRLYARLNLICWRFAFDSMDEEPDVRRVPALMRAHGLDRHHVTLYCLIGFPGTTPEECLHRLNTIIQLGLNHYPMRYFPLNHTDRKYVAPGLERARTQLEQRREQLGLGLKQSHEVEALCLAAVNSKNISSSTKSEQAQNHRMPGDVPPGNVPKTTSHKRLPWWGILVGSLAVVGIIIVIVLTSSHKSFPPQAYTPVATSAPAPVPSIIPSQSTPPSNVSPLAPVKYTFNVVVTPAGGGTISPNNGIYDSGSKVTLLATPSNGYQFISWSGDASGTNPSITITMDSNKNVVANFAEIQYHLTISVNPPGSGTVSPSSGTGSYGATVSLTESPTSGYRFDSWSGDISGSYSNIGITMNSNKNVIANFKKQFSITISTTPSNAGSVSPAGGIYDDGTVVTLTATAVSGYYFASWSGDASGTRNSITVAVNSAKNIIAKFGKSPLTVVKPPWNIGTGTGDLVSIPPLNQGDTLSFSFTVSGSSVYYDVYDPNGNIALKGSSGNKVMAGQASITAAIPGNYKIHFISSGIITSSVLTISYTISYPVP